MIDYSSLRVPEGYHLTLRDRCSSTNTELMAAAVKGAPHGSVLLTKYQSSGKGSRGRNFFSPEGGIYFSVLLRDVPTEYLSRLTPLTALAVYRALRPFTSKSLGIKWVNDIYLEGKKVCGILTENRFQGDNHFSIVGIGINLYTPKGDFPEFPHPAAALLEAPDPAAPSIIVETILKELDARLPLLSEDDWRREYKSLCLTLSKQVILQKGDQTIVGIATDILPDGALQIQTSDGALLSFGDGEVTSQTQ